MAIKVGQSYKHPQSGQIINIDGIVTNNLSKVYVRVNGNKGTMKVKDIEKKLVLLNESVTNVKSIKIK